jgi:hypothetical protein
MIERQMIKTLHQNQDFHHAVAASLATSAL